MLVAQLCPTPCDPVDCNPPGSSVHGTPQARMLEWVSRPSSRGSSWPRTEAGPPALQVDSSLSEPPGRPPRRSYHGTHLRLRCRRKLLAAGPLGPQTKVILNIWQPLPLAFKPGHTPNNSEWPCFITPWPALAITQLFWTFVSQIRGQGNVLVVFQTLGSIPLISRIILISVHSYLMTVSLAGLPRWPSGEQSACYCGRLKRRRFHCWVRKILWKKERQPTPALLPEKSHGRRSLVGCSPWSCKESDSTDQACPSFYECDVEPLYVFTVDACLSANFQFEVLAYFSQLFFFVLMFLSLIS